MGACLPYPTKRLREDFLNPPLKISGVSDVLEDIMAEEALYVVTCNGVRYTMPMSYEKAEAYRKLRQEDKKNGRDASYGGSQRWAVEPA